MASQGYIDNPNNVQGDPVYIYHGSQDSVVRPGKINILRLRWKNLQNRLSVCSVFILLFTALLQDRALMFVKCTNISELELYQNLILPVIMPRYVHLHYCNQTMV